MKRLLSLLLALSCLFTCFALTSCGGRDKVDISGAKNLNDLAGATIAAQTGTFHLDALNDQLSGVVTVREYADFTKLLVALKSGAIDGYVAEEPTALAVIAADSTLDYLHLVNNETGFTATDADTGIAVAFATGSPLVSTVNQILRGVSLQQRAQLMAQIVRMSENPDAALGETIVLQSSNTNTSNGVLKIAMECAYAPFNWAQTTDANGAVPIHGMDMYANGYDVQIAKYIAAELGMKLEIYASNWDSLVPGVTAGTYDAIIAGMSPTEERERKVDFTECYYNSNLVIIYKKNS